MAHDLATTNGRVSMAYHGVSPWHGLGKQLDQPATAAEAIESAGLNYEVRLTDLCTSDGTAVPRSKAVVRQDARAVLGIVSERYIPVQNRQCFGFLDAIVADGGLRYETAGALGQGERIWLLAKLPHQIRVLASHDVVDRFLLLSNSHDGSAALRVFFTPIRVVCQNTLGLAHRTAKGSGVSILHKGNISSKIRDAQRILGLAERFYDDAAEKINLLARYRPSDSQLRQYFASLYPDPLESEPTRARQIRERLTGLFESGVGQDIPQIRHTMWAALNAVTEYVDHHRSTRARDASERARRRLESAWFGSGSRLKAIAWDAALKIADGSN